MASFMLIAGEASGDTLAAELVQALKTSPAIQQMPFPPKFFGAGGPRMAAAGVELAADLTRHSIIGLAEALQKYWVFKRIFDQLLQLALERRPDVLILVDFSGFNRRFAHAVRQHIARAGTFNNWRPRIVQYVSPQVWASRPGRAWQLAEEVDLLLSTFPFEPAWYAARVPKLRVEFVGNPIADRYAATSPSSAKAEDVSTDKKPLILILPGSRTGELRRHLPVMLNAAQRIQAIQPVRLRVILPSAALAGMAKRINSDESRKGGRGGSQWGRSALDRSFILEIQVGGLTASLAQADFAITKTGTITLECAWFGVPSVAIYKTSWLTYLPARAIVSVKYLAMPNLLAGEPIFPEFIQHAATGENIAREALSLLNDAERRRRVQEKLAAVRQSLGTSGAARRAAEAILKLLPKWKVAE